MINSINVEKTLDKSQHPFIIKTLNKLDITRYDELTYNTTGNGKKLKVPFCALLNMLQPQKNRYLLSSTMCQGLCQMEHREAKIRIFSSDSSQTGSRSVLKLRGKGEKWIKKKKKTSY